MSSNEHESPGRPVATHWDISHVSIPAPKEPSFVENDDDRSRAVAMRGVGAGIETQWPGPALSVSREHHEIVTLPATRIMGFVRVFWPVGVYNCTRSTMVCLRLCSTDNYPYSVPSHPRQTTLETFTIQLIQQLHTIMDARHSQERRRSTGRGGAGNIREYPCTTGLLASAASQARHATRAENG